MAETEQQRIARLRRELAAEKKRAAEQKAADEAAAAKKAIDDAAAATRAAQSQAASTAAQAAAEKSALEAQMKALEAQRQVDAAKRQAEDAQRVAGEKSAGKVGIDLLATAGKAAPFVAGAALGLTQAVKVNRKAEVAAVPKVREFEKAGKLAEKFNVEKPKKIAGTVRADKLKGVVSAADRIGVGKLAGKVGLVAVGGVVAEGLVTSFVAPRYIEDPMAKEAVRSVGGVSLGFAAAFASKRKLDIMTFSKNPSAASVAAIEGARTRLTREGVMAAAQTATPAATKAASGKVAAKLGARLIPGLGWVLAGAGAIIAGAEAYKRGGSAADIIKGAALGAVGLDGLVTPAQASTEQPLRAETNTSGSVAGNAAVATAMGAASVFNASGSASLIASGVKSGSPLARAAKIAIGTAGLGVSAVTGMLAGAAVSNMISRNRPQSAGSLDIAREAAGRTAGEMRTNSVPDGSATAGPAMGPQSDGMTDAYTRIQNGRSVHVKGYGTPTR